MRWGYLIYNGQWRSGILSGRRGRRKWRGSWRGGESSCRKELLFRTLVDNRTRRGEDFFAEAAQIFFIRKNQEVARQVHLFHNAMNEIFADLAAADFPPGNVQS